MLSTLSALYGHLTETGAVAANPAALHRGRLGLTSTARDASPTVRLTAAQTAGAAARRRGGSPHPRSAAAPPLRHPGCRVRRLLTLGLRISELSGSTAATCTAAAATTCCGCSARAGTTARCTSPTSSPRPSASTWPSATGSPVRPPRRCGAARRREPLVATRETAAALGPTYTRCCADRRDAGPEPEGVADRVHPRTAPRLRRSRSSRTRIHHVQADVGHASIATTSTTTVAPRTRATTAADLVAAAIAAAAEAVHRDV